MSSEIYALDWKHRKVLVRSAILSHSWIAASIRKKLRTQVEKLCFPRDTVNTWQKSYCDQWNSQVSSILLLDFLFVQRCSESSSLACRKENQKSILASNLSFYFFLFPNCSISKGICYWVEKVGVFWSPVLQNILFGSSRLKLNILSSHTIIFEITVHASVWT